MLTKLTNPSAPMMTRLAAVNAVVLVAGLLSIGQVHYEQGRASAALQTEDHVPGAPDSPTGTATPLPGASASALPSALPSQRASIAPNALPGGGTTTGGGSGQGVPRLPVPDLGMVTQGVTADSVTLGVSYNVSGCGDSGTFSAAAGQATVGDPQKAFTAFSRYVNDTGGVGGRTLKIDVADDGAGGCPEKEQSAAVKLVDDDKVFAVIPGINPVGDYAANHHIPVFGGRDDPTSIAKYAPNELGLLAPLDPTFEAWASFGAYDLGSTKEAACLIHPDDSDWNSYERLLRAKAAKYHFAFKDVIRYSTNASQAVQQANAAAQRMRNENCQEVWYMDWNGIGAVFLTAAATQNGFFPKVWTFTSYTALMDYELSGRLMDKTQWKNARGLSARVPPGQHPAEGQCSDIYKHYYGSDGNESSASVMLACAQILTATEDMRRGIAKYGVLTADTLLLGAGLVHSDFFFDAHVPLDYHIPGAQGPFDTKGQHHFTVCTWDTASETYQFPQYPKYWKAFGPGLSGSQDLRKYWAHWQRLPIPN